MKYCMKCGVSIDELRYRHCPLCNTVVLRDDEINQLKTELKLEVSEVEVDNNLIKIQKVKSNKMGMAAFIVLMSSLIAIFTVLLIDFLVGLNISWSIIPVLSITLFLILFFLPMKKRPIYRSITIGASSLVIYFLLLNYTINQTISWAYYIILSIVLVWIYITTLLVNKIKGFVLKIAINLFATAIFVLFMTLGYQNNSVFAKLALPINGLVFVLTIIAYFFIKTYIYNWKVIISTLSLNISLLCLGIDLLIQRYIHNVYQLKWSYIVLIVLFPITLLMMYLNNRYQIHSYLKKKFHI